MMIKTKNLRLFFFLDLRGVSGLAYAHHDYFCFYIRARIILMIVALKRKGEKGGRGSCVVGSCGILEKVFT
jgi:hypothetical protein